MKESSEVRIRLLDVDVINAAVRVRLELRDQVVSGSDVARDPLRATARATLEAVSQLVPDTVDFRLESVQLLPPTAPDLPALVVVIVTILVVGTRLSQSGSALVRETEQRATAAAVLDALNRRLAVLGVDLSSEPA